MKHKYKKGLPSQAGAITIIFLTLVALVLTLILAATQSSLTLALRRSQSASDILIATYRAESEANDVMARLIGGYLTSADISDRYQVGDMRIEVEGQELGDTQIVTVTAFRGLAVGKVQAVRRLLSVEEVDEVEIILALDCTSSMDYGANCANCNSRPSRLDAQEQAAINFVESISNLQDSDKFKVGVSVFGIDSAWLQYNGVNVTPGSGLSFSEIQTAISQGFSTIRKNSPACIQVANGTSVGTAFRHSHDYFTSTKAEGTKQIEVVITDGEPNARIADSACSPGTACTNLSGLCNAAAYNYLRCTVADTTTQVDEISSTQYGARDPEVDAYAVTIFDNPPQDVVTIFQKYATEGGYFNANRASELSGILSNILGRILEDRSTVTIKRIIPIAQ